MITGLSGLSLLVFVTVYIIVFKVRLTTQVVLFVNQLVKNNAHKYTRFNSNQNLFIVGMYI
jgi:hypothetical protein